jgi:hypothetical protein
MSNEPISCCGIPPMVVVVDSLSEVVLFVALELEIALELPPVPKNNPLSAVLYIPQIPHRTLLHHFILISTYKNWAR